MEIIIDGKKVKAEKGETLLSVAKRNNIDIPFLCFHSDLDNKASCRVCVVETEIGELVPSCKTEVREGMEIKTRSEKAEKTRKINLELLFSQHQEECFDCIWNLNCKMLDLAKEYNVEINRFEDRKKNYPIYHFGASLEFDSSKCIDCRNCVEICKKQGVEFLEIRGKGHLFEVFPSEKKDKDCVYCGQCIVHCPAGAFEAVGEFEKIEKPFENKGKKVIFQIAPAVRATIGEEFGLPFGFPSLEKLVAGLKKIGGDEVFDVSLGADVTTIEESKEFLERFEKDNFPMLTSCCPAWVRFVELYYPEFIPNLTSVRSPNIILGGLVKEHYRKKYNINPEDLYVVSVMPCVAKKHEIQREEFKNDGYMSVDYVMTTREVGRLFKKKGINFKEIEGEKPDCPFGSPSGSGVTYGVSGGVMKSAYHNITGEDIVFNEARKGVKEAKGMFQGKEVKFAIVHGLGRAKGVLEEMKKEPRKYDYIEVMACYDGCIGGGGQSVPFDEEIRKERKKGLCKEGDSKEIRRASSNPEVKSVYDNYLSSDESINKLCHTKYSQKYKSTIRKSNQS